MDIDKTAFEVVIYACDSLWPLQQLLDTQMD